MTTPTYTPHRVRLVGHRDLGIVRARWAGCILELEDGTRHGPSALFEVQPVPEPASKPEPVGTWGGHEDWIAWDGGPIPVDARAEVEWILRGRYPYYPSRRKAGDLMWRHTGEHSDIIAYRLVTPAALPVQEPAPKPKPAAVLLKEWRLVTGHEPVWYLYSAGGLVEAGANWSGWWAGDHRGPETGLRGKENAVKSLLNDGAEWVTDDHQTASHDHGTRAIRRFRPCDVAVMVDGSKRTIENGIACRLLFTDGTWLTHEAAETAIAARVPADDGSPF
jgi:hypothetical protein